MVLELVQDLKKSIFVYNPKEGFTKEELIKTINEHKYILPYQDPSLVDIVTGMLDFLGEFKEFCLEDDIQRRPIQEMNSFIFGNRKYLTSISVEEYWTGTPFRHVRNEIIGFYSKMEEILYTSRLKSYVELEELFDSSDLLN